MLRVHRPGGHAATAAGPGTSGGWVGWVTTSLRRQISVTLRGTIVMLLVLGALCATAVLWSARSLSSVNETSVPLQTANKDVLQEVTDAEAAVRGYVLSEGDRGSLQPYLVAVGYLPQDQRRLRELSAGNPQLTEAVLQQEAAIERWLDEYVEPQLSPMNRGEKFRLYTAGKRLFDDVKSANADVDRAIGATTQGISERARAVLFWTLVAVVLLPLLMIAAATAAARRISAAALEPLDDVSEVLGRLREGDLTARADERGPVEVREIAAALNRLAEESLRGQGLEDTVASRLGEIDRVRTELVSTVSHELRTPLTNVQGYLELLQDQVSDRLTAQEASMMDVVQRNLLRLQELITNMLTLSRAEEAGLKLETLDLRAVAAEATGDIRMTAAARAITVSTIAAGTPVTVVGDRSQLYRVVTNLVSNAVKFSEPGDVVEVRVAGVDREAVLEVVDEGIGIPAGDLDGLGSRFFRASNAMRSEIAGTGLGLRIVQTILDRHGGSVDVESVEDAGTTVTVRLPLTQPALPEPVAAEDVAAVPAGTHRD